MKRQLFFLAGIVPLFLFSSMCFYACAVERTVTLNEVPTKVIEAFKQKRPDVLLADWSVHQSRHKTLYEASWKIGVRTHHDVFDENGNLISVE